MRTGSSHSKRRRNVSRLGGGNITRVALTGRCRIERRRNLPRGSQRIRSASPSSPLETLLRPGTEIEGRPSRASLTFVLDQICPGRSGKVSDTCCLAVCREAYLVPRAGLAREARLAERILSTSLTSRACLACRTGILRTTSGCAVHASRKARGKGRTRPISLVYPVYLIFSSTYRANQTRQNKPKKPKELDDQDRRAASASASRETRLRVSKCGHPDSTPHRSNGMSSA